MPEEVEVVCEEDELIDAYACTCLACTEFGASAPAIEDAEKVSPQCSGDAEGDVAVECPGQRLGFEIDRSGQSSCGGDLPNCFFFGGQGESNYRVLIWARLPPQLPSTIAEVHRRAWARSSAVSSNGWMSSGSSRYVA